MIESIVHVLFLRKIHRKEGEKRMKHLIVLGLCLCMLLPYAAMAQGYEGSVWPETAPLYAQPSQADAAIAQAAQGSAVTVTGERENGFLAVTLPDGTAGWMPEPCVAQPVEGEWNGYETAAVLCESLSMRQTPDSSAPRLDSLTNGEVFVILEERDGWYLAVVRSDDGAWWHKGWVLARYTVSPPSYVVTGDSAVDAYAYPAPDAPCVAEVPGGARLLVIAQLDGYDVVSLRGASAFIRQDDL